MMYTEKDFQKELRETMDALYQKAKSYGLFPDKTEVEKQKEYEDAQRAERANEKYMTVFKEIPKMWERISYFADKGVSILVNPNIKNHGYTANTITLTVSSENPNQLSVNEIDDMVTVIDKLKSAEDFYSKMMESYNNHPLKGSNYLDLLTRYIIVKYINKPYYGYIEDRSVSEMLTAMMLYMLDFKRQENEQN